MKGLNAKRESWHKAQTIVLKSMMLGRLIVCLIVACFFSLGFGLIIGQGRHSFVLNKLQSALGEIVKGGKGRGRPREAVRLPWLEERCGRC